MKIRVPKEHRPPTRFGIVSPAMGSWPDPEADGKQFRVKSYRLPKKGEFFWYPEVSWGIGHAKSDFEMNRCVILEEVKP